MKDLLLQLHMTFAVLPQLIVELVQRAVSQGLLSVHKELLGRHPREFHYLVLGQELAEVVDLNPQP